jgi:four helix bundle protein
MHQYKNLEVWKRSMSFIESVYAITNTFPVTEQFGLTSQIRRAGVSIASNIGEGAGRGTKGDFKRFLSYSKGSACEIETQLILSEKLGFIPADVSDNLLSELNSIKNMLYKLDVSIKEKQAV